MYSDAVVHGRRALVRSAIDREGEVKHLEHVRIHVFERGERLPEVVIDELQVVKVDGFAHDVLEEHESRVR